MFTFASMSMFMFIFVRILIIVPKSIFILISTSTCTSTSISTTICTSIFAYSFISHIFMSITPSMDLQATPPTQEQSASCSQQC